MSTNGQKTNYWDDANHGGAFFVEGPLVSCLTATYGRYRVLKEALACFVQQDYAHRELIVLNNHAVPLHIDLPNVRVINDRKYPSLGDCRNALLAEASGAFVRTWDDDDLYLPWAISQGVRYIGEAPAFKPRWNWGWKVQQDEVYLSGNKYEAAWTVRIDVARRYGYQAASGGNEHNPLEEGIQQEGGILKGNVTPAYVYRIGSGLCRISGSLDKEHPEQWKDRTERWKQKNDDHGAEVPITLNELPDMSGYWKRLNDELAAHTNEAGEIVR